MLYASRLRRLAVGILMAIACWAAGGIAPGFAKSDTPKQEEAPFGLTWGISAEEVKALGAQLAAGKRGNYGQEYAASNLPRVLADAEHITLFFGFDDRLWRIVAISKAFPNDPYGYQVKARYDSLAKVLREKYGPGAANHAIEDRFYRDSKNFMYGVSNGSINYFTNFDSRNLSIQLAIRALALDSGVYVIYFEHKHLKQEFEKSKVVEEKKAL